MVLASPFSSADLDRALVMRARAGDQDAFALLMDQYGSVVRRLVTRFVQDTDDARDVEQDTWIRAAEKLDSLRDEGRFRPWVKSIARHSALNFLASSKRRHDRVSTMAECGTEDFEDEDGATPEGMTLSRDNQRKVWETLGALSERDRTALFMREYQGENYAAISERLGISRNAAEVCVFRARERFRRLFIEVDGKTQACGLDPLRLSNLIDGEGDPESTRALRDHVASCPSCDERLVTMQAGQALYRNLGAFGFPMGSGGLGIFAKLGGLLAKITSMFGGGAATTAAGGGAVATGGAAIAASGGATSMILTAIAAAVVVVTSAVAATGIAVPAGAEGLPETPVAVVQEVAPASDVPPTDDPGTVRPVVPPGATPAPVSASVAPEPAIAPAPDETTPVPPPTSTGPTSAPPASASAPSAVPPISSTVASSTEGAATPEPTATPPAPEGEGGLGDGTPPTEPPPGQAEGKATREGARVARAAGRDEAKAARAVEREERKAEQVEAKAPKEGAQPDRVAEKAGKTETKPNRPEPRAEPKGEPRPEAKAEAKSEPKPEPNAEAKAESKPEPRAEPKGEPRPEAKAEPKSEPKPEPNAEAKAESKPEPGAEPKGEPRPEPKAEPKSEPKPEPKAEPKSEPKPEPKAEAKGEPKPEPNGNGGGKKK